MIKSMTAFGIGRSNHANGFWLVEIKCVNSKFLDYQLRTPTSLNALEERIKKHVAQKLSRGRVTISISLNGAPETQPSLTLNLTLLDEYKKILTQLKKELGDDLEKPNLGMLLNNHDLVMTAESTPDIEEYWKSLEPALDQALAEVYAMRQAEGANLAEDMRGYLDSLEEMFGRMQQIAPKIVDNYKERLKERITRLLDEVEPSPERLAQEVAFMADRCDINEELARAASHLLQFRGFLKSDTPVGRKLDFLVQELNREANTMGSKSPDAKALALIIDIKAEIEKLREQIQNIE